MKKISEIHELLNSQEADKSLEQDNFSIVFERLNQFDSMMNQVLNEAQKLNEKIVEYQHIQDSVDSVLKKLGGNE